MSDKVRVHSGNSQMVLYIEGSEQDSLLNKWLASQQAIWQISKI